MTSPWRIYFISFRSYRLLAFLYPHHFICCHECWMCSADFLAYCGCMYFSVIHILRRDICRDFLSRNVLFCLFVLGTVCVMHAYIDGLKDKWKWFTFFIKKHAREFFFWESFWKYLTGWKFFSSKFLKKSDFYHKSYKNLSHS